MKVKHILVLLEGSLAFSVTEPLIYSSRTCHLEATASQTDYNDVLWFAGVSNDRAFLNQDSTEGCDSMNSGFIMRRT